MTGLFGVSDIRAVVKTAEAEKKNLRVKEGHDSQSGKKHVISEVGFSGQNEDWRSEELFSGTRKFLGEDLFSSGIEIGDIQEDGYTVDGFKKNVEEVENETVVSTSEPKSVLENGTAPVIEKLNDGEAHPMHCDKVM